MDYSENKLPGIDQSTIPTIRQIKSNGIDTINTVKRSPELLKTCFDIQRASYDAAKDGNVCNSRSMKSYSFDPQNYSLLQNMFININSGMDSVFGPGSYLMFDIEVTPGPGAVKWSNFADTPYTEGKVTFARGSACNLFKHIRLTHSISGVELEYINHLNALIQARLNFDNFMYDNLAEIFGGGSLAENPFPRVLDPNPPFAPLPQTRSCAVPMHLLSGIFSSNVLIPPQLMNQLRIEIGLESMQNAFISTGAPTSVIIKNVRLVLDSLDLFDSVKKTIVSKSLKDDGIQFTYNTYFNDQYFTNALDESPLDSNQLIVNFDIQKTMSKPVMGLAIVRDLASLNTFASNSICCSVNAVWDNVHWRIGGFRIPQDPIRATLDLLIPAPRPSSMSPQQYFTTMKAFDNTNFTGCQYNQHSNGILIKKYVKGGPLLPYSTYNGSLISGPSNGATRYAVIAQSFERSPKMGLSCEPVNFTNLLNFSSTLVRLNGTKIAPAMVSVWVQHVLVANCMGENLVLDG